MLHLAPLRHPFIPDWSLSLVLAQLMLSPFELMASSDFCLLMWKMVFLVAIMSTKRSSELCVFMASPPFSVFHKDKVVLHPDPTFLPKVLSSFHLSQPTVLPVYFLSLSDVREHALHTLDVRCALSFYLARTSVFCQNPYLFVTYGSPSPGQRVSSQHLAGWIKGTISLSYELACKPLPRVVQAHATRAIVTLTAFLHGVLLHEVCAAATWSSPSTFVSHYALDVRAHCDAAFGHSVLAAVFS